MRSELRATLKWCLEYEGEFTAKECAAHFNVSPKSIRNQFDKLAELGLLDKTYIYKGRHCYLWRVIDAAGARYWVDKMPKPRSATVNKSRSNKDILPARVVNSVFSLGSL